MYLTNIFIKYLDNLNNNNFFSLLDKNTLPKQNIKKKTDMIMMDWYGKISYHTNPLLLYAGNKSMKILKTQSIWQIPTFELVGFFIMA